MSLSFVKPVQEPGERLRILFQKGNVEIDKRVPIRRYFRSCQELIRMAGVYFDEKNLETSYVYYAKFIVLSFEKLKMHPEYEKATTAEKNANKKALKNIAFPRAEKLKNALKKLYEDEYEKYMQYQEKLAELAQQEEERKQQEEQKLKEKLENIRNQKEHERKQREKEEMDAFLKEQRRKELELERLAIEREFGPKPQIDKSQPLIPVDFAPPPTDVSSQESVMKKPTFDRSLKPTITNSHSNNITAPATGVNDNVLQQQISTAFAASLTLSENRYGLRTILSPSELPSKFMKVAHSNTVKNIETCGVLFGKLANEVFVITHVLLPHQKGAPDSCDTTREEDMWDFQDQYNGICLGWIHTHPSQTAFLSSVDLHTHYPYQCLMPESVAIVCSGKYNEIGYFMLTPNHGMNVIGKCHLPGFHPHPKDPPLFEGCDHVKPSPAHTVQIVDWRNK